MGRDSASPSSTLREHKDVLLAEVEKRHILETLESHGWNKTRTAEALGISLRTLYARLREWGMVRQAKALAREHGARGDAA